jgi:hypothetical protein
MGRPAHSQLSVEVSSSVADPTNTDAFSLKPSPLVTGLRKLAAALFLAAIVLTPIAIVLLWPKTGTIWVAGYIVGIATVPVVAFGALGAVNFIFGEERLLLAFVLFSLLVVAASIASVLYGLA